MLVVLTAINEVLLLHFLFSLKKTGLVKENEIHFQNARKNAGQEDGNSVFYG
jgi:hypothetical protein